MKGSGIENVMNYIGGLGRAAALTAAGLGLLGGGCATQPIYRDMETGYRMEGPVKIVLNTYRPERLTFDGLCDARREICGMADRDGDGVVTFEEIKTLCPSAQIYVDEYRAGMRH